MEQEDYLLKEIEKIGIVLKMIFNSIACKAGISALTIENRFIAAKGILSRETGFDIDEFLALNESAIEKYLLNIHMFNGANIELLADILKEIGMNSEQRHENKYLTKALHLYEMCNAADRTFSFERENKINNIKEVL